MFWFPICALVLLFFIIKSAVNTGIRSMNTPTGPSPAQLFNNAVKDEKLKYSLCYKSKDIARHGLEMDYCKHDSDGVARFLTAFVDGEDAPLDRGWNKMENAIRTDYSSFSCVPIFMALMARQGKLPNPYILDYYGEPEYMERFMLRIEKEINSHHPNLGAHVIVDLNGTDYDNRHWTILRDDVEQNGFGHTPKSAAYSWDMLNM